MQNILSKIDLMIDECAPELVRDTRALVAIKSTRGEPSERAPFGEGPQEVLELFTDMCKGEGLITTDYGVGIVSASLKDAPIDVGIWLHGDVVPEGDGWSFPPYELSVYRDCMIGRGSNDNKGQLSAIYNLFKIFKRLGVSFNYNPAIFLGSNEECGMKDLTGDEKNPYAKGFLNLYSPPRLSLISDGGFPVGIGGKGGLNITLKSNTRLRGMSLRAGTPDAPGTATAVLDTCDTSAVFENCTRTDGEKTVIESYSPPRHASRPDPNGNMVTALASALLDSGAIDKENRYILEFFNSVSKNVYGQSLDIYTHDSQMGNLTVFIKEIVTEDGFAKMTLNIRHPISITFDEIVENVAQSANNSGFSVAETEKRTVPYVQSGNEEIVRLLFDASKQVPSEGKKERDEPYFLEGGTYAHFLPNAYVFGSGASIPPDDFEAGKGLSHGVDEAVSIPRLKRSMKIYARALLGLNDVKF